jgi:hypothetical protein
MPEPTWDSLVSRFDPMVLVTPRTAADPLSAGRWPTIYSRVVIWLLGTAQDSPGPITSPWLQPLWWHGD